MANIVLVPGAWLGGWCWQGVAPALRAAGHTVYPVTLSGLGERVHLATPEIDLETHITDVANLMLYEDLTDVILVGHSYAGIVVDGVADRLAERISQLVYLDSGPLGNGIAQIDFYPSEARELIEYQVAEEGDGWRFPLPSFEQLAASASLAGLGPTELERMRAKATPQPFQTFLQPLRLTRTQAPNYGRVLIACSDGGFSINQIKELIAAGVPAFQALSTPDWRFHEIPTGHWPMFSAPDQLAGVLLEIAAA